MLGRSRPNSKGPDPISTTATRTSTGPSVTSRPTVTPSSTHNRLPRPLPMNRFRPNILVSALGVPYAGDSWADVQIGDMNFSVVKACARCATTTTDQMTVNRSPEPLAPLVVYRRVARGVLFGQNLIHSEAGTIAVGDPVEVRRGKAPPVFLWRPARR